MTNDGVSLGFVIPSLDIRHSTAPLGSRHLRAVWMHRLDIPPRVQVIIDGLGRVARSVILWVIDVNAIPMRSVGTTLGNRMSELRLLAGLTSVHPLVGAPYNLAIPDHMCQWDGFGFDVSFDCAYGFNRSAGVGISVGPSMAVIQPNESIFRPAASID
jgi:hypothetical protein